MYSARVVGKAQEVFEDAEVAFHGLATEPGGLAGTAGSEEEEASVR